MRLQYSIHYMPLQCSLISFLSWVLAVARCSYSLRRLSSPLSLSRTTSKSVRSRQLMVTPCIYTFLCPPTTWNTLHLAPFRVHTYIPYPCGCTIDPIAPNIAVESSLRVNSDYKCVITNNSLRANDDRVIIHLATCQCRSLGKRHPGCPPRR